MPAARGAAFDDRVHAWSAAVKFSKSSVPCRTTPPAFFRLNPVSVKPEFWLGFKDVARPLKSLLPVKVKRNLSLKNLCSTPASWPGASVNEPNRLLPE